MCSRGRARGGNRESLWGHITANVTISLAQEINGAHAHNLFDTSLNRIASAPKEGGEKFYKSFLSRHEVQLSEACRKAENMKKFCLVDSQKYAGNQETEMRDGRSSDLLEPNGILKFNNLSHLRAHQVICQSVSSTLIEFCAIASGA